MEVTMLDGGGLTCSSLSPRIAHRFTGTSPDGSLVTFLRFRREDFYLVASSES